MPAKSRRNRRSLPPKRKISTGLGEANPAKVDSYTTPQSVKISTSLDFGLKQSAPVSSNYPYLLSEIKWIGVVTGIILILLVISYLVFH